MITSRLTETAQGLKRPEQNIHLDPETLGYCRLFSADWWLISCALGMMIYTSVVGSPAIVVFIACAAAVVWRSPGLAARSLGRYFPILLFSLFVLASTAWSDAPDVTLKQGLEFLLNIVCYIIIIRRISGSDIASALLFPSFTLCALCLAAQPSALHGAALQGFVASKNLFAFLAQTLVVSALTVFLDTRFGTRIRMFALVGLALGVLDVILARSAGAWITTILFALTFLLLRFSINMTLGARVLFGIIVLFIMLPYMIMYKTVMAAAQNFQVHVLHKDATLTGRTGLWTFSKSLIAEKPVLGHGFAAFWRQGNLDAEGLWRTMGIAGRYGFNFHNQFIDVTVDFGYVGLALLIFALAWIAAVCLLRVIVSPSIAGAFLTAILVALYARLPVESLLIGPWNIFTLLWLAVAIHSVSPLPAQIGAISKGARDALWRPRNPKYRTDNPAHGLRA